MTPKPRVFIEIEYDTAAESYLRSLKTENIMESPEQATQREITLESLALVKPRRKDLQVFNELLVQYPNPNRRKRRPQQVVPDNMVVLWRKRLRLGRSYILPLQPCGPFWVMEYVSKTNRRKDYDQSMYKYEHELKVPYYLLFVPEEQEMTLYHHNGTRYVSVQTNEADRCAIPPLEMEIGVHDGWVRYWYQGKLLPLPAELQDDLDNAREQLVSTTHRAEAAEAEVARLRKQLAELEKQQRE